MSMTHLISILMGSDRIGHTEKSRTWGHRFYAIQLQKGHVD